MKVLRRKKQHAYSGETEDFKFNPAAGADKVVIVGPCLKPIPGSGGFKTNLSSATNVGLGVSLAIYNPTNAVLWATVGDSTVTLQTSGGVQSGTDFAAIPLKPNDFTYISTFDEGFVITSAGVYSYIIEDDTYAVKVL